MKLLSDLKNKFKSFQFKNRKQRIVLEHNRNVKYCRYALRHDIACELENRRRPYKKRYSIKRF